LSRSLLLIALSAAALMGCPAAEQRPPAPPPAPAKQNDDGLDPAKIARARGAIKQLKRELMRALMAALPRGGPTAAIKVCKQEAPRLAAAASRDGLAVGRTSHKLRSPANAPRAWVAPLLRAYSSKTRTAALSKAVPLVGGRVGYVEPIFIKGPCLRCHGASISPEIAARLRRDYPNDRATGFSAGDFRGLFWVEVK
jgi:Protein of unknown function (DUF3365)